jgi:hypothetical protein
MTKPKVEVSIDNTIKNTIQAMERVTSAVLAGNPAGAGTISGKKVTAQFSFRMRDPSLKKSIEEAAHRKMIAQVFQKNAVQLEAAIKKAVNTIIHNMVGLSSQNVQVMGRSLGNLTAKTRLEDEQFAKFIKSKKGAGEIGLPDPDESLNQLRLALIAAITVDVVVRRNGPQIKFRFDQRKLLKLTPHPDQFEPGAKGAFYSWLSLLTGPSYLSGGTPGYALVRVGDIQKEIRRASSKNAGLVSAKSLRGLKKIKFLENAINVSRTKGYAGEMAGLMLKTTKTGKAKKTQSEFFGGKNKDYQPSKNFEGFWDKWWVQRKQELSVYVRRVMTAAVRSIIKG